MSDIPEIVEDVENAEDKIQNILATIEQEPPKDQVVKLYLRKRINGRWHYITGWRHDILISELTDMTWLDEIANDYGSGDYTISFAWNHNGQARQKCMTISLIRPETERPAPAAGQVPQRHDIEDKIDRELERFKRLKELFAPNGDSVSLKEYLAVIQENAELRARVATYEMLKESGIMRMGEPEPESPGVEIVREIAQALSPYLGPMLGQMLSPNPGAPVVNPIPRRAANPVRPAPKPIKPSNPPPPPPPPMPQVPPETLKAGITWLTENRDKYPPEQAVEWLTKPEAAELAQGIGLDLGELIKWFVVQNPMTLSATLARISPGANTPENFQYLLAIWKLLRGKYGH